MSILKRIASKPENEMADADHPNRKDITAEEFDQALNELAEKYKDAKAANPMTPEQKRKRGEEILKAMNKSKDDC